ncbi:MAG: hypothetical protein HYV09_14620 [Deltaproteobacteria bacterium]|nr:hypothetical protein [Deltaproteobacteria bacterium]
MNKLIAAAVLLVIAVGCQRASTDAAPAPAPAASGSSSAAAPSFETATYKLEIEPIGAYKKGEAATFRVVLRTKGEFHVNEEYPTKFKASDTPAVRFAAAQLGRADHPEAFKAVPCASGKDNCTLELTVGFTPQESGKVRLGGEMSIGVCNKDNCIFDKKTLEREVPVS